MSSHDEKALMIRLTEEELAKLKALAAGKTKEVMGKKIYSVQDCIREFARTCQPGGSGWAHPAECDEKETE